MDGSKPPTFDPVWAAHGKAALAPQAVPPMLLGQSSGQSGLGGAGFQLPPGMVQPGAAPPMVLPMDPKSYGAAVGGHVATLVLFSVSWCAPCKLFQPAFEHAVPALQAIQRDLVVGTVDCEAYPQFRAWEQIKEFPTVRFYRQGSSDPKQWAPSAAGEWSEEGLVRWVQLQFGVAPPAPPPPPHVSAAEEQAYLRAMRAMVERTQPPRPKVPALQALVPTTDALTLSGAAPDERVRWGSDRHPLLSADVTSSLAPLVGRLGPLQQKDFWTKVQTASRGPLQPSADEQASYARRLAAEATRAETLGLGGGADLDGDGDGDEHEHEHGGDGDETFTDWIGDEEMPEGIDDALTD